jgi:hypothetical protein
MIEAYCWPQSVVPGEPVALHLSTYAPTVQVEVARDGAEREVVWSATGVPGEFFPTPDDASSHGCGWPAVLEIPVGPDWRSGYYAVTVTAGDQRADAFVVVRSAPDPEPAPILMVLSTTTWSAYNDWGGPSLYTGGTRVSFERPMAPGFLVKPEPHRRKSQPRPDREALWFFEWAEPLGLSVWSGGAGWWNWERPMLRWAEANGFRIDVAVSQDLEAHPDLLEGRRMLLSVGHDEYWSRGMREAVEAFTATGGNAAFFSGNTCYWQVRFEDDLRQMVGFKYGADLDPVVGTPEERLITSAWVDRRIGWPEFSTTGLSFSRGGYSRYGLGVPKASGAYTVWRPDHWVFEGADLAYGDALGLADAIVAYEVDGCELTLVDGLPVPTHSDGAPDTLEVLATAPAKLWTQHEQPSRYAHEPGELESVAMAIHGEDWEEHLDHLRHNHAAMAVFTTPGGGTVFNAGCTDWTDGLGDPAVERITRNVFERLSG